MIWRENIICHWPEYLQPVCSRLVCAPLNPLPPMQTRMRSTIILDTAILSWRKLGMQPVPATICRRAVSHAHFASASASANTSESRLRNTVQRVCVNDSSTWSRHHYHRNIFRRTVDSNYQSQFCANTENFYSRKIIANINLWTCRSSELWQFINTVQIISTKPNKNKKIP